MSDLDYLQPAKVRRTLVRERDDLLESSTASAGDRRPVELDQQSVGRLSRLDAMRVQAMAEALEANRQLRLRRIIAALKRLDEGEYGTCAGCGEPIPPNRLIIDLTLTRCVDCAG